MAFSEFKQKLGAFNTSHLEYVEKQKTLRDSTMWDDSVASGDDDKQVYAVIPPVEYFMNLPSNIKKQHFFQSISCADCFIGEVSAIQANGLILRILCMEDDLARDLDHTNVAVVPLKCLPSFEGRGDPLAAFQLQDRVRAVIVDIDAPTHRIWASMNPVSLRSHQLDVKLGLINDDELPLNYREMVNVNNKSYEECLKDSPQFNNKGGVDRLCAKLGIDVLAPLSLMHAVNKMKIPPHQFADEMRKKQTYKLALKHVAKGVGYFREKKHTEAMQCFNHALSVDKNHVEGLVARGALYATLSSFKKAMEDLELALEVEPNHKDAANYLAQVLVVYGRQRMDGESMDASEAYFQRALKLNPWMEEAKDAMIELRARKLEKLKPKVLKSEAGRKGSDVPTSEMKRAHDTLLQIMRCDQQSSRPPDPKSMWDEDEKAAGRVGQSSLQKPSFSRSVPILEAVDPDDLKEPPRESERSPMSRREPVINREPDQSQLSRREPISNREPDRSSMSRTEPVSNREPDLSQLSRRESDLSQLSRREPVSNREPDRSSMSRTEPVSNREPDLSQLSRRETDLSQLSHREAAFNREHDRSPRASRRKLDRSPTSRREYDRSPMSRREYDQPPMSRRKLDHSPVSRHEYDRSPVSRRKLDHSPMSRHEYDRSPVSRRKRDRSPMSQREYNRSPVSRREYDQPPMSRRKLDQSPMSRQEYDRSPVSRRKQDHPALYRRNDKPSSHRERIRSPYYDEDYPRSRDSYPSSLSRHDHPPSPTPRDPYRSMPGQESARYSQHELPMSQQGPSSVSHYSNQTLSPYSPGDHCPSPLQHEIPGPSIPAKGEQKIKDSAYDPANPSDTNFFIYAEQDGLFQAMKGNKALTSDDMDDRFLIVKNSFSVAKPAPPKPPQGPRFMTPSSPDPLPAPPPPPPSLSLGQFSAEEPTAAPPTTAQTSFTWLRTKAKPGTSASATSAKPKPAVEAAKPKPAVEAAKPPVVSAAPAGNPFVASVDPSAKEAAAPRAARNHPFLRRAKAPAAPTEAIPGEDSKRLVVEVNASEEGEHRRVIKRRSPDGRKYRRRSDSQSSRSRSKSRSPTTGIGFLPKVVSGDDEHAKMVNAFLFKLSARDKEEARVRERVRGHKDHSEDRSSRGRFDDSPRRERSLASRHGRGGDSPRSSARRRGSPGDDRSRRGHGSPDDKSSRKHRSRDDRPRRRDSPGEDRLRRRGSPGEDRSRRRGSPGDDRPRRRGSPGDNRSRRRGSPGDDRFRRRGSPGEDRWSRRDGYREDGWNRRDESRYFWSKERQGERGPGSWGHFFDKSSERHSKGEKEERSGDKEVSEKKKAGPREGEAKAKEGSSKEDHGEQSKSKEKKEVTKEESKSGHGDAKENPSDSKREGDTREIIMENDEADFEMVEGGDESYGDAGVSGRGTWRGRWRGDWRGRGRGEWRGRGRGEWRGRGRGTEDWIGRGRGEWRGRGRGAEDWIGRGRIMEDWSGRGRGEWRGRGRGIEDWRGRGRGTEEWRGRGRGYYRSYWRGNLSYSSLSDWRRTEERYDNEWKNDAHDSGDEDHREHRKRKSEDKSSPKDNEPEQDPEADGAKPGGKRKLFLPSAIDVRNVTTGAPVPSPPRPLDWSPKRWASVQKKIRAIEARKSRHSPWRSPERVAHDKGYMITRGQAPKPSGSKYSSIWDSKRLPDSHTPPHETLGPAEPDSPENFPSAKVEAREIEPSTSTGGETQTKEMGTATSKGKVTVKKGPTPSLAQMESFMKELKAKAKPS